MSFFSASSYHLIFNYYCPNIGGNYNKINLIFILLAKVMDGILLSQVRKSIDWIFPELIIV